MRKEKIYKLVLTILMVALLAIVTWVLFAQNSNTQNKRVSNKTINYLELENILKDGAKFFENRNTELSGLFVYDFNLKDGKIDYKDNIVRQMGAFYALGLLQGADILSPGQRRKFQNSLQKVLDYSKIVKKEETDIVLYKFYDKNIAGALALLYYGIALHIKDDKDFYYKNKTKIDALKNTLLYLQKEDGDFASFIEEKYTKKDINSEPSDPYSTGEILNAFAIHLKQNPGDEKIKQAVSKALKSLDAKFQDFQLDYHKGLYLWFMSFAYNIYSNKSLDENFKDEALSYAIKEQNWANKNLIFYKDGYNSCAFTEGLAMYLKTAKLAKKDMALEKGIYKKSIIINKKLQVTERNKKYILDTNKNIQKKYIEDKYAHGAFLDRIYNAGTRIDFTQHCIAAFIPYLEIMN